MSGAVLTGQVAIVTGGAQGIGRAIVDAYRAAGASVLTCGRRQRPDDLPDDVAWKQSDLTMTAECEALITQATQRFGRLDVLVNNAGVQLEKTVADSTDDDWDQVMGINARALFRLCRSAIPVFRAQERGVIINMGSISAGASDPRMALYNASKGFVHALTRSIAVDHGHEGIRCNAICPGWIMTDMADAGFALAHDPEAARRDALARHPVGRFGEPSDIAQTALWLTDPRNNFVTGQTFTVDGGLTAASPLNPGLF